MKKLLILSIILSGYLVTNSVNGQHGGLQFETGIQNTAEAVYEPGPAMNSNRHNHHAVVLPDGNVVLIGGRRDGFVSLNTAEIYDPEAGTFTTLTMNHTHDFPAFARMNDGRYLIAGGTANLGIPQYAFTEIFNPADLSFTQVGNMVRFRASGGAAALTDDRVVIASAWWVHNDAHTYGELFDTGTQTFTEIGPFTISRSSAVVVPTNDGHAMLLGGVRPTGNRENLPVENINPETGEITVLQESIIEETQAWIVRGDQAVTTNQLLANGSYLWLADYYDGDFYSFNLISIDPETKAISVVETEPALPNSETFYFMGHPVIDNENNRAYLIALVMNTGSYTIAVFTVDLAAGTLTQSSNYYYPETYQLRSAPAVLLNDGRIFVSGGSVSNNFDAVNHTLFITPPEPVSTSVGPVRDLPETVKLKQNYPNPFNPSTNISFETPEGGFVQLEVFDLVGRRVEVLINGYRPAGRHSVGFEASSLASGMYIYRLTAGNQMFTRKMMLMK